MQTEVLCSFIAGKWQLAVLQRRTSWLSKSVRVSGGDELNVNELGTSGFDFLPNRQGYEN